MAGFAEQNEFLPAGGLYQGIVIAGRSPHRLRMAFQHVNNLVIGIKIGHLRNLLLVSSELVSRF